MKISDRLELLDTELGVMGHPPERYCAVTNKDIRILIPELCKEGIEIDPLDCTVIVHYRLRSFVTEREAEEAQQ